MQAEYVRMVRTALLQRLEEGGGKVVQITSAGSGSGKTTLAVMLAESLARCGKKVLLVDADLRNPSIHERCDIAAEPGLLGVLKARVGDPEAIVKPGQSGISVLPIGKVSAEIDGELLANGVLAACLRRWCGQFDLVLLDSAPVLPVADARILSRLVDGTILVVREKHCHRAGVADALAQLGASGGALLGMVFVGSRLGGAYGGGYYDYRYPAADTTAALDAREG
jgi:capsular exopolysaccharide synthesis family protein